jgi:S-adenosylmethionine uptake transporter
MRGALFMSAAMAGFTLNDALMKFVSGEMSMFQALFIRGAIGSVLLVALAAALGMLRLQVPRRDRAVIALRTAAEIAAAWFFITALFNMPIANAAAIMQALPLTVTLAGAMVFGERIGWRRLSAILLGFAGVMLIVRPGAEGFTVYSVYVVIAVLCVTVRDLAARGVSSETSSMTVAIAASVGVWLFAAVGMLGETWQPVGAGSLLALVGASAMIMSAYLFSILTMRSGDIAFVAPFRYFSLLWALVLGLVIFGDWPDALTLLGAAIVVATGVFSFHRERNLAAAAAHDAADQGAAQGNGSASVDNPRDSH